MASAQDEPPDPLIGRRLTFNGTATPVNVERFHNPTYFSGSGEPSKTAKRQLDFEIVEQRRYPEATLLVSATEYKFCRNCHDFAWGPWMTWEGYPYNMAWCGPITNIFFGFPRALYSYSELGPQKEAWLMGSEKLESIHIETSPRSNWQDGSMVDAVQSVAGPMGESAEVTDWLFNTEDLDALQYEYEDVFGSMSGILQYNPRNMIGLPVCDPVSPNGLPVHAAVLVDWMTAPGMTPDKSVGIFISKWGNGGVWLHRWGYGLCPGEYCVSTEQLHVFVPSSAWGGLEYWVFYSPW